MSNNEADISCSQHRISQFDKFHLPLINTPKKVNSFINK